MRCARTKNSIGIQISALLLLLVASASAIAQPKVASASEYMRVSRMHIDYQLAADGSYVETSDSVQQLISEQAVHAQSQIRVPYSASLDEFRVLEARTIKKNGRSVPVPQASIFTQDGLISPEGVTSFQDIKTTVVVFPEVEPGDSIALRTEVRHKKPMLPGIFSLTHVFPGDLLYDDVRITVTAPRGYPLYVDAIGVGTVPPTANGDRVTRSWTYRGATIERTEDSAVDARMYRPRLFVSSIGSYDKLAAAATQRFADKAKPTAAIRTLAQQITAGARDTREQVQRIHQWVAKNVRYFSVVLDVGGYVPRPAEEVMRSRFGDCKDHAVLLQALLAARGIPSYAALLTTEPLYELPRVPVLGSFNHVIVYVPQIDAWLETNAPSTPFGVLAFSEIDKPVVYLAAPQTIGRTPAPVAMGDATVVSTQLVIRADGSASGQDVVRASGPSAASYAAWADSLAGQDPVRVARQLLLNRNLIGEGTVSFASTADGAFEFTVLYELPDFVTPTQEGSLRFLPPMDTFESPAVSAFSDTTSRRSPYVCLRRNEIQKLSVSFPPGLRLAVPADAVASGAARSYKSSYRVNGNQVLVERHYDSAVPRAFCGPEQVAVARTVQGKILRDLRSEIRYVPVTAPVAAASPPVTAPAAPVLPIKQ